MKFEYSLAQLTVLDTSPVEISRLAVDCGYDYVSLRQIFMDVPGERKVELVADKKELKEVKEIIKSTGLKVLDLELARIYDGVNVKEYEKVFELANELGTKNILSSIWTDNKPYYIEKFNELCELAKEYNLNINLEFVPIAGVKNLKQAIELIENTEFDNARHMIDTHHFQRSQDKVEELLKIDKKLFNYVQICDVKKDIPQDIEEVKRIMREDRLYCGEGETHIDNILNAIPIVPYSIELPNHRKMIEIGYKEHAKKCLETAKAYCEKLVVGRQK